MKFLLKQKVFEDTTKDKRNNRKIGPLNIYESLIKLRKDEESTKKANVLQLSDQGENNNNRQIKKRCAGFNHQSSSKLRVFSDFMKRLQRRQSLPKFRSPKQIMSIDPRS
jgi:hypothetical protein